MVVTVIDVYNETSKYRQLGELLMQFAIAIQTVHNKNSYRDWISIYHKNIFFAPLSCTKSTIETEKLFVFAARKISAFKELS